MSALDLQVVHGATFIGSVISGWLVSLVVSGLTKVSVRAYLQTGSSVLVIMNVNLILFVGTRRNKM